MELQVIFLKRFMMISEGVLYILQIHGNVFIYPSLHHIMFLDHMFHLGCFYPPLCFVLPLAHTFSKKNDLKHTYRKTPNRRPPPINAPPCTLDLMLGCFSVFLAISRLKMVRFSFRKKLLEGENALFKSTMSANAHGRLLGVLRYFSSTN